VSPFHDLGPHCGGPLPARTRHLLASGARPSAVESAVADAGGPGISLPRFAWLLALGLLGLAGLLSLGVGGVSLVQVDVSPGAHGQKSESVVTR
jgi:hypothetical protein